MASTRGFPLRRFDSNVLPQNEKATTESSMWSWILHSSDKTSYNFFNGTENNFAAKEPSGVMSDFKYTPLHGLFVFCSTLLFLGTPVAFYVLSRNILGQSFDTLTIKTPVNIAFGLMFVGLLLLLTVMLVGATIRRTGEKLVAKEKERNPQRFENQKFYGGALFAGELVMFAIIMAALLFHVIQFNRNLSQRFNVIEIVTTTITSASLVGMVLWEGMELYKYRDFFQSWTTSYVRDAVFVAEKSVFPVIFGFGIFVWYWAWTFTLFTRSAYIPVMQNTSSFVFTNAVQYMHVASYALVFVGFYIAFALMNVTFFYRNEIVNGEHLFKLQSNLQQSQHAGNLVKEYLVEQRTLPSDSTTTPATMRSEYTHVVRMREVGPLLIQGLMALLNISYAAIAMGVLLYGDAALDGININHLLRTIMIANTVLLMFYFVYLAAVLYLPVNCLTKKSERVKFGGFDGNNRTSFDIAAGPSDSTYGTIAFTGYTTILMSFYLVVSAWSSGTMYRELMAAMDENNNSWEDAQVTADHAVWSVGTMYRINALMLPLALATGYSIAHALFRKLTGHQHIIIYFKEHEMKWPWREWLSWGASLLFTLSLISAGYMFLVDSVHLHGFRQWPVLLILASVAVLVLSIFMTFSMHVFETQMSYDELMTPPPQGQNTRQETVDRLQKVEASRQSTLNPIKKHLLLVVAISLALAVALSQTIPTDPFDYSSPEDSFRSSNLILQQVVNFNSCFVAVALTVFGMDNVLIYFTPAKPIKVM